MRTAGTSRRVDTIETNQAATGEVITLKAFDFGKPLWLPFNKSYDY